MRLSASVLGSLALTTFVLTISRPREARADPQASTLGRTGQVVFDDVIGFRTGAPALVGPLGVAVGAGIGRADAVGGPSLGGLIGYGHLEGRTGDSGTWKSNVVWVAPSVDVFVGRRVSLGASLGFSYSRVDAVNVGQPSASESYSFAAMPRIGYAVPLAHGFSIWPRVGFGYARTSLCSYDPYGTYMYDVSTWMGGADLGLVFQATPRVFFATRPELTVAYSTTLAEPRSTGFKVSLGAEVALGITL